MSESTPEYRMSEKAKIAKIKAECRSVISTAVKEIVSWNGLSSRTREKMIRAFGKLWHQLPERELDVNWCFDFSIKGGVDDANIQPAQERLSEGTGDSCS